MTSWLVVMSASWWRYLSVARHLPSFEVKSICHSVDETMPDGRRHIPYLSFHKAIIREICRPQKDDLLIIAKGLGLRRVSPPSPAGARRLPSLLTFRPTFPR